MTLCSSLGVACSAGSTDASHAPPRGDLVEITSLQVPTQTPDGPWLTANVTPEDGEAFVFSPSAFLGGSSASAWGFEAVAPPARALSVAIAGPVEAKIHRVGTEASGTFGRFVDAVTYDKNEAIFYSTAGTLTVTRIASTGPTGAETYAVDGAFDIRFSNDGPTQLQPPAGGGTRVVGTFGNIVLQPYATR